MTSISLIHDGKGSEMGRLFEFKQNCGNAEDVFIFIFLRGGGVGLSNAFILTLFFVDF